LSVEECCYGYVKAAGVTVGPYLVEIESAYAFAVVVSGVAVVVCIVVVKVKSPLQAVSWWD
jgi:uncharacterized iron-regulated membrane protein